jgi:hypothetical protein
MRRSLAALAIVTLMVAAACDSAGIDAAGTAAAGAAATAGGTAPAGGSAPASADPVVAAASPSPSPSPRPTADPEGALCLDLAEMEERLAGFQTVELRLPNRVALEIELDKLLAAHGELTGVDLGGREDELERSLTRLGYRLGELELAVEDFATNTRPRRAAPHVAEDTQKVADELAAFVILSRC